MNPKTVTIPQALPSIDSDLFGHWDKLFSFGAVVELVFTVSIIVFLFWASHVSVRFLWRLGYDRKKRLESVGKAVRTSAVVWLLYWILSRTFESLPLLALILVTICLAGLVVAAMEPLQNFVSGILLLLRRQVTAGDEITIGGVTGTIHNVDLMRTSLILNDGSEASIPNRSFNREQMVVRGRKVSAPIQVRFPGLSDKLVGKIRDLALLSPYRSPETDVHVDIEEGVITVTFTLWSKLCARNAQVHLERMVEKLTSAS